MSEPNAGLPLIEPYTDHPRLFRQNKFVYPVLSRRSRGISVGINLNPDKVCNFDCIYCQVDRRSAAVTRFVEIDQLLSELDRTLELVVSQAIYGDERFEGVPMMLRRLNDIAFSGDGEPTTFRNIPEIVERVAAVKQQRGLDAVKLVMITNASMFHRPGVQSALATLDANNGEIWAKLDAGTEAYFQLIDRTTISFQRIVENIRVAARAAACDPEPLHAGRRRGPSPEEIAAFCARLKETIESGGALDRVQVYTIARRTAESYVTPLSTAEVDAIAAEVVSTVGVPVEAYYGATD